MKKLYATALAAVVTLSASAQTLTSAQELTNTRTEKAINFATQKAVKADLEVVRKAAPKADALTLDQICGDYYLTYTVELQNSNPFAGETTVTASGANVVINFPFVNGSSTLPLELTAAVDLTTGELSFSSKQTTGYESQGATLVFRHWNNQANGWESITDITATYDAGQHAIVFDQDDAIGLQATSGGWYTLFDMITLSQIIDDPNADPNEGWTSVGNAKFVDPWVLSGFTFNDGSTQWDLEYEVELQQNDEDKDVYRLVDPYKGNCPVADMNQSTAKHGYIQFNISDPDHVSFDLVESGWANSQMGITQMYCYNILGMYAAYFGYDPAYIVQVLGDQLHYTTYKDGVIELGSYEETDEEGAATTHYDAMFGIQGKETGGYTWNGANMTGRITFPGTTGIESLNVENNNAPVEYYNLQGVRVDNPAAGTIFIRRQGNTVTKILK